MMTENKDARSPIRRCKSCAQLSKSRRSRATPARPRPRWPRWKSAPSRPSRTSRTSSGMAGKMGGGLDRHPQRSEGRLFCRAPQLHGAPCRAFPARCRQAIGPSGGRRLPSLSHTCVSPGSSGRSAGGCFSCPAGGRRHSLPCSWASPWPNPVHCLLFLIGAIAMRGAGCTYNDIVDRSRHARLADPPAPPPLRTDHPQGRPGLPRAPGSRWPDRPAPVQRLRHRHGFASLGIVALYPS